MSEEFVKLMTPTGPIYIRKTSVVAVSHAEYTLGANDTLVQTSLWICGDTEGFNILENPETVLRLLK